MKKQSVTLNKDFTFRPATEDDLEELLDILNDYWEAQVGIVKFTIDDFRTVFSVPGFDITSSFQVVTTADGKIIGAVLVMDLSDPPIHPSVYGCVHPEYEGQGIGRFMLQWAEERAKQAIVRCPDDVRVSMHLQSGQSHPPTIQLFEKFGLSPVRYAWLMAKSLDEKSPDPVWPEHIQLKTYQDLPNLEALIQATDEAFEDHWGYVDRSEDEGRLARIRHSINNNKDFDPSLWFLAMDGDEIAGLARCEPRFGEERTIGLVDVLGVRRAWRRQGLGLALLHHAFNEFHQRGYQRVMLGVDSQNLSGATRLYEKAGMHVDQELATYEKELRAGTELAKQTA